MFQHRLRLVLILLATIILLQGLGAVLALREAERKIVQGRIASDIHQGFVELSATKQRLRSWVTQYKVGAGGNAAERDALMQTMQQTLERLAGLAQAGSSAGLSADVRGEQQARIEALAALEQSLAALRAVMPEIRPLEEGMPARTAWDALSARFDQVEGQDLRQTIQDSIAREAAAVQRERQAADASLAWMQLLWLGTTLALALTALLAVAYSVREASRRHRLESQLELRTQALHAANESLQQTDLRRRQLLADISHELRTPTTAIRGEAEVTLRGRDRPVEEYREALTRIVDTSRQLGTVIDDLLAMARSDLETLTIARESVDFRQALKHALGQASSLAAQSQVQLLIPPLDGPALKVLGDGQRLAQMTLVLLDNAIRYSNAGGSVRIDLVATPDRLVLNIVDQGIGIEADELPRVFERHFRGRQARRHRAAGSGLGLPIAQALAQAHGGTLTLHSPADSAGNGGTRACLTLPLLRAEHELND